MGQLIGATSCKSSNYAINDSSYGLTFLLCFLSFIGFRGPLVSRVSSFFVPYGGGFPFFGTPLQGNVSCHPAFSYQLLDCILEVMAVLHLVLEPIVVLTK